MKKIVLGVLAHVDAGKTTLSESMLYLTGTIRQVGRVDNGNAFLDYDVQEKRRGITIFSKQAQFQYGDTQIVWVDTPGHVDFSTEMERTLQVLDYAIVIINGLDGVQTHSETVWNLLKHYKIPTFVFVNKMDMSHYHQEELMNDIKKRLDDQCIDFGLSHNEFYEAVALGSEDLLNNYLENNSIENSLLVKEIQKRHIFPVYFGSALKMTGIEELLKGINTYTIQKEYSVNFGARVFKITRDEQGNRLTHMKITGGSLKTKDKLSEMEKADQIRIYSGNKYQVVDEVKAGDICAIKGLKMIQAGDGLGFEESIHETILSSYMNYRVLLPEDCDPFVMLANMRQLAEEDPTLRVTYSEQLGEIRVQLMGEIQIEILKNMIQERYHVKVGFDQGNIVYKETITEAIEGVGHYEPLRHYAEVHVLMEPGERGSGLQFINGCLEDVLDRHWQRLIMTHLEEKEHLGVFTGSPITDIKITLLAGKAHLKHTEGGDFRQATYRAIRHGLKSTTCLLLEPYYQFKLDIPQACISKAIYDIEAMHGQFVLPDEIGETVLIEGSAPVSKMQNYQNEVTAYTKGKGRLICSLKGYEPCFNQVEVIEEIGYDSESDLENPTGSVFCSHGAGFNVKWDEVINHMHINAQWKPKLERQTIEERYSSHLNGDEELEDIFVRTYGAVERRLSDQINYQRSEANHQSVVKPLPECLLVDGYNVIHSWPELKVIADENLDVARSRLIDIMSNYQGYKQCLLILVFDAYKVKQNLGTVEKHHNISIVYTKEAQTADMYIERATHELAQKYCVIVATSDALEQLIVVGQGARRMSSRELKLEVEALGQEKFQEFERKQKKSHAFLLEGVENFGKKG